MVNFGCHMISKSTIWLLCTLLFVNLASADEGMPPSKVKSIFLEYESINKEFLSSVGSSSEGFRRKKAEAYAEGDFEKALTASVQIICKTENTEIIHALFHVTHATLNSASESQAWTLGRAYVCKPEIVAKAFQSLSPSEQAALYESLSFGFENTVYKRQDAVVTELREKLHALEPDAKK